MRSARSAEGGKDDVRSMPLGALSGERESLAVATLGGVVQELNRSLHRGGSTLGRSVLAMSLTTTLRKRFACIEAARFVRHVQICQEKNVLCRIHAKYRLSL